MLAICVVKGAKVSIVVVISKTVRYPLRLFLYLVNDGFMWSSKFKERLHIVPQVPVVATETGRALFVLRGVDLLAIAAHDGSIQLHASTSFDILIFLLMFW